MFFTPRLRLAESSVRYIRWVEGAILRRTGLIQDATIGSRHAKKAASDPWSEVLLDFINHVCLTGLVHIADQSLANCFCLLIQRLTKISFEELLEGEVNEHAEEKKQLEPATV